MYYSTTFPLVLTNQSVLARKCVDNAECVPTNLIGLRINYSLSLSITHFKRLY